MLIEVELMFNNKKADADVFIWLVIVKFFFICVYVRTFPLFEFRHWIHWLARSWKKQPFQFMLTFGDTWVFAPYLILLMYQ